MPKRFPLRLIGLKIMKLFVALKLLFKVRAHLGHATQLCFSKKVGSQFCNQVLAFALDQRMGLKSGGSGIFAFGLIFLSF